MNLNEKIEQVIEKDDMMSSYISFILYSYKSYHMKFMYKDKQWRLIR